MCEYQIRLSSFDAEISAALLAYENAFDTGDRHAILRTWREHNALQRERNLFIEIARDRQRAA